MRIERFEQKQKYLIKGGASEVPRRPAVCAQGRVRVMEG
jgi:hypothetical protein